MQHYRLLRNNSESGPYTQQDLIDLGLKAYDLIWMEGKSSSWKYPSEVETLKAFAPPVTEDLYVTYHTPKLVKQPVIHALVAKSNTSTIKHPERRYVSVILPSVVNSPAAKPSPKPATETVILEKIVHEVADEKFAVFQADSSIALSEPVSYKSNKRYLMAGAFLAILTTGIYFGTANRQKPVNPPDNADRLSASMVSLTNSPVNENNQEALNILPPNKSLDFASVKRYIQVSPSAFDVGFFGGISDLTLTIKNSGKSKLANIVIAVDYLNKNRTIDHTENVVIPALSPSKSITVIAPDSPVGIAIQTRIIGINDLSPQ